MKKLIGAFLISILAILPAFALEGPEASANVVLENWATAFNANDAKVVVGLYAPDALLHGTSSPTLNAGTEAITQYFKGLPGSGLSVKFGQKNLVPISDNAVMGVGFYEFSSVQNGVVTPRPARFTFVISKRGDR